MVQSFTFTTFPFALLMCVVGVEQACIHDEIPVTHVPATTIVYDTQNEQNFYEGNVATRLKRDGAQMDSDAYQFRPLRIHVHHSLGITLNEEKKQLLRKVVDRAVTRITSILSVVPATGPLLLSRSCGIIFDKGVNKGKCARLKKGYRGEICLETFKIPDEHLAELYIYNFTHPEPKRKVIETGPGVNDTDLILYLIAKSTRLCRAHKQSVLAYAAHCRVDQTGRPIAGLVNVCPLALARPQMDESMLYQTVLHEILHVLGFSVKLFGTFRRCIGRGCDVFTNPVRPVDQLMRLVTPSVVNQTQEHFDCRTEPDFGGPLEIENSIVTSHWDSRLMHTSLMTALHGEAHTSILDPITLAVFEDSSWYQVDFQQADKFFWGRDAGCRFGMPESCIHDKEHFCTGNSSGCHFLRHNKAECDAVKRDGSCGLYSPVAQGSCHLSDEVSADGLEIFSPSSRCFLASVTNVTDSQGQHAEVVGRCYERRCSHNGSVHVRLQNSDWIRCDAGQTVQISGLQGEIHCPADVDIVCDSVVGELPSSTSNPLDQSSKAGEKSSPVTSIQLHFTTSPSNGIACFAQGYTMFVEILLCMLCWSVCGY